LLHQLGKVLLNSEPPAIAGAVFEFVAQECLPNRSLTSLDNPEAGVEFGRINVKPGGSGKAQEESE
jgi:hypothetical protein